MSALDKQIGGNHYKNLAIQPAEYSQLNKLRSLEGGVIKYVTRHRDKGKLQDILKAIHCLELLIELEYKKDMEESIRRKECDANTYTPTPGSIAPPDYSDAAQSEHKKSNAEIYADTINANKGRFGE